MMHATEIQLNFVIALEYKILCTRTKINANDSAGLHGSDGLYLNIFYFLIKH